MKRSLAIALGVYAGVMTAMVIQNAVNNRILCEGLDVVLTYLNQKETDAAFAQIIEDFDD